MLKFSIILFQKLNQFHQHTNRLLYGCELCVIVTWAGPFFLSDIIVQQVNFMVKYI